MSRTASLSGRSAFKHLHGHGDAWSSEGVRIRYLLNQIEVTRLALSVPRTCGNAVKRNRIRRVWREVWRGIASGLPVGEYHVMIRNAELAGSFAGATAILAEFREHLAR